MRLTKDKIESMCRAAGMQPVERAQLRGYEVYIADGFSAPPHWKFRHFGVGPDAYPMGAYFTFWYLAKGEGHLDVGAMIHCDALHDAGQSKEYKQKMRINTAIKEANKWLDDRRKVAVN